MIAAEALLAKWARVVQEDPGALLVGEGGRSTWTDRRGVELLRQDWSTRLRPGCLPRTVVMAQSANGADWLGLALAVWELDAILVPLDPLTREAERARLVEALRPALEIVDGAVKAHANPRRFRAPVILGKVTSGSSGTPKALFFSAAEMIADGRQVESGMGIGRGDLNLAAIPFGHSYGLGNLVLPALIAGRPVVCASAVFPRVLIEEAVWGGATVFPATPPLLRSLLRTDLTSDDWPQLRLVICAGARLDPALACSFATEFGRPVHNFYGSSETGGIAFDRSGKMGQRGETVGMPLPGVRLTSSRSGRLVVSSPAVCSHGNRCRLDGQPAVVLADRGQLKDDGAIILRGRTAKLLKIGARRVDAREIEGVLRTVPGVVDCLVALCPGGGEGDILGAVVAGNPDRAHLRSVAKASLAAWKVPKRFRVIPEMPITARGKLDRAAALAWLTSNEPH